jgi:hypothetical protein
MFSSSPLLLLILFSLLIIPASSHLDPDPPSITRYQYVDGITGNNNNDGLTPDTPLATLGQAVSEIRVRVSNSTRAWRKIQKEKSRNPPPLTSRSNPTPLPPITLTNYRATTPRMAIAST